jgi:hypothetical protein
MAGNVARVSLAPYVLRAESPRKTQRLVVPRTWPLTSFGGPDSAAPPAVGWAAVKRAIADDEVVEFVERVVTRDESTRGFGYLEEAGRLDLTVEALVADATKPFHSLFALQLWRNHASISPKLAPGSQPNCRPQTARVSTMSTRQSALRSIC